MKSDAMYSIITRLYGDCSCRRMYIISTCPLTLRKRKKNNSYKNKQLSREAVKCRATSHIRTHRYKR